jgi:hypothetical protein
VGSILAGVYMLIGPIAAASVNRYLPQEVTTIGYLPQVPILTFPRHIYVNRTSGNRYLRQQEPGDSLIITFLVPAPSSLWYVLFRSLTAHYV